jgi:hypothetical protein
MVPIVPRRFWECSPALNSGLDGKGQTNQMTNIEALSNKPNRAVNKLAAAAGATGTAERDFSHLPKLN